MILAGGALGAAVVFIAVILASQPTPETLSTPLADSTGQSGAVNETAAVRAAIVTPELVEDEEYQNSKVEIHTGTFTLTEIFERSEAGVVRVNVRNNAGMNLGGVGSGFVLDNQGHIITNDHVISNATTIVVTFLDGSSYDAKLVGTDRYTDVAVIRVDADLDLRPLMLGNSSDLKVGEQVAAIGNPFGLSGSMTAGIVSQVGRLLQAQNTQFSIPDVIQTDAPINPGNSGGPLLNMQGEVVGINTAIQSATGQFVGIGFAVPSQTVAKIVPHLISEGAYRHPWLGVSGQDIDPDLARILDLPHARGFLIMEVIPDSPAEEAGLRGFTETVDVDGRTYRIGGDIVTAVDGIEVRKIHDILVHLQRHKSVGDEMILQVLREGTTLELTVVLGERPEPG